MPRLLAFALLIPLAACDRTPDAQTDLDQLDRELTDANSAGNLRDPAIAQALHDQIMVDPGLTQSSNANAVRPPSRPDFGATPLDVARPDPVDPATLRPAPAAKPDCPQCRAKPQAFTLAALAAQQPRTQNCAKVSYSAAWANRLPAALPLYPDARVVEAAGNDASGCALHVVTFSTSASPAKLVNWYHTHATAAGYSAEHRADGTMHVLGGAKGDAAYMLYASPRQGGGAEVDLVSTGR